MEPEIAFFRIVDGKPIVNYAAIRQAEADYARSRKFFDANRAKFREQYPDQWVGVFREQLVGVAPDWKDLFQAAEAQGIRRGDVLVEFLDTKPRRPAVPALAQDFTPPAASAGERDGEITFFRIVDGKPIVNYAAIRQAEADAERSRKFFAANRAKFREQYPDQWVGVFREQLVGVSPDLKDLFRQAEAQGIRRSDVLVEFLDTKPRRPAAPAPDFTPPAARAGEREGEITFFRIVDGKPIVNYAAIRQFEADYARSRAFFDANRAKFLEQYPDQWVGVFREQLVAVSPDLKDLFRQAEAQGIRRGDVMVEFMGLRAWPRVLSLLG